jgi:hypothetical protein
MLCRRWYKAEAQTENSSNMLEQVFPTTSLFKFYFCAIGLRLIAQPASLHRCAANPNREDAIPQPHARYDIPQHSMVAMRIGSTADRVVLLLSTMKAHQHKCVFD